MKPRIAIFMSSFCDGGAERVMLNLANGMAEAQLAEVDLLVVSSTGPRKQDVNPSVNLVDLGASRIVFSVWGLVRYVVRRKPEALISALNTLNVIAILAKLLARQRGTRFILTEHNTLSVTDKNAQLTRAKLLPFLVSVTYRFADGIVGVSHGVADDLATYARLDRHRIEVIYNPVITPSMQKMSEQLPVHRWIGNVDIPVLLGAGRLSEQKDFPNLLVAMVQILNQLDARLIILGDGEQKNDLIQLAEELGISDKVDFPGYQNNPYSFMSNVSVFVLSSRWEGLPTVLIEALHCGARLVSTDCPSGPREILRNGELGRLVPVADSGALAEAVIATLAEDTNVENHDAICSEYTLDYVVRRYLSYCIHGSKEGTG